jgi:hypothetical protein
MSDDAPPHATLLPPELETARVLVRFAIRMVILTGFSFLGNQGFASTFASFLAIGVLFCACMAAIRWDLPGGPALAYWDEAAAYGLVKCAVHMLNGGLAFFPGF